MIPTWDKWKSTSSKCSSAPPPTEKRQPAEAGLPNSSNRLRAGFVEVNQSRHPDKI